MCGLVGLAGNCTVNYKDVFTDLLLVDVLRGHHSTGAAFVRRDNNDIILEKAPVPSPMWIGTQQYQEMIKQVGIKAMIGHNRYATVGEKNAANAHPFAFPGLVGAHNGTLKEWARKEIDVAKKFGTDSEAIFANFVQHGVKDTIGSIDGAWALTWFDAETNTMNLLRNKERPLFYCYSADRETMFWASEATMLEWILGRRNVKLFDDSIYPVEEDMHYRWTLPEKISDKFEKPTLSKVTGGHYVHVFQPAASSATTTAHYGTAYGGGGTASSTGGHQHSASCAHTTNSSYGKRGKTPMIAGTNKINTAKFRPPYKDAYGRITNKVLFTKLVETGCIFCETANQEWGEFIFQMKDDMDGRKLYLCEDCYNDDDIRKMVDQAL